MGIPTDCPQRDERLGWMGDAHVFWDAACFNMDTAAFTRKFMRDVRDAQRDDGSFPDIAPNNDREHFTPPGSSPGWGMRGVPALDELAPLWRHQRHRRTLERDGALPRLDPHRQSGSVVEERARQ
jgi:hypothetical protein